MKTLMNTQKTLAERIEELKVACTATMWTASENPFATLAENAEYVRQNNKTLSLLTGFIFCATVEQLEAPQLLDRPEILSQRMKAEAIQLCLDWTEEADDNEDFEMACLADAMQLLIDEGHFEGKKVFIR